MGTPSLASRLGALRDLPLARAFLERHLTTVGPLAFARELEPVLERAALGAALERDAILPLASWVAHTLAAGEQGRVVAIGAAADPEKEPRVRVTFGQADARAKLLPRGRLADVGIPVFADLLGVTPRMEGEPEAEWRSRTAWIRNSPGVQSWRMQRLGPRLRMHHEPIFIRRLLDQRWISTREVVMIAARRPTVPAIVLANATRDRWLCCAPERQAIAENPYTPGPLARVLAHVGAGSPFLRRLGRASRAA
jgi:hypothetical protein